MLGKRKQKEAPQSAPLSPPMAEPEVDDETGLIGAVRFEEALEKEIDRAMRYGSNSALALFEVEVAERATPGVPLPSPAKFVAHILKKAVRSSDIVARVSPCLFAVLLIEARAEGARLFTERVRTSIGSSAYARRADGSGVFARAWSGVAQWEPASTSVEAYASAAEESLAGAFRGYDAAAQEWSRHGGLSKPFPV